MIIEYPKVDLAWAAGFFDGEGSIGCYPNRKINGYLYPAASVSQTRLEPLLRFKQIVGFGNIITAKDGHSHWKLYSFEKVQFIICLLWNFLSEPKKEQAKKAISKYLSAA